MKTWTLYIQHPIHCMVRFAFHQPTLLEVRPPNLKGSYKGRARTSEMSLLPIVKLCTLTRVRRLFSIRNVPQYSPLFKLRGPVEEDDLGRFMAYSSTSNCRIVGSLVVATSDIAPGTQLTRSVVKETTSGWQSV